MTKEPVLSYQRGQLPLLTPEKGTEHHDDCRNARLRSSPTGSHVGESRSGRTNEFESFPKFPMLSWMRTELPSLPKPVIKLSWKSLKKTFLRSNLLCIGWRKEHTVCAIGAEIRYRSGGWKPFHLQRFAYPASAYPTGWECPRDKEQQLSLAHLYFSTRHSTSFRDVREL